ncbi:hypothetical protein M441DRAFT_90874 [Trichoderma asperellum CBS 433.97]|uniref:Uncharacterized protein n=1 Tax=Trichoderma asperellum (strain ATCC 204424 / CBS 433.97 / NBRC 101777) TaxID=1042311 RepID=A0A2T3Z3H5_TRIA4|nr:hypothetical protein M441DRAFT_90874 [Trichoderma asperellum CBS 433.97]PTB39378.1 hypothetical protein M441DRAFT_90874 [Trichoderma asperellum CBS 433.97]
MPDSVLNYASWAPGCLPSCPSSGKLLIPSLYFLLHVHCGVGTHVMNIYFTMLLLWPSFILSLLALSLLSRASRGAFSPDTQTPVTSHFRVYSHSVPTSILLYRSTSLRTAISSQYYEPYDINGIQSLNLSSNYESTNSNIFVFMAFGDRSSVIHSPTTKSQYNIGTP